MRVLFVSSAMLLLTACSGAPSKSDVKVFLEGVKPAGSTVEVNDLRCAEQDNQEYKCFVNYTTLLRTGASVNQQADEARFRKANGEWESTILSASYFTRNQPE